jgi:hypothetical protein
MAFMTFAKVKLKTFQKLRTKIYLSAFKKCSPTITIKTIAYLQASFFFGSRN